MVAGLPQRFRIKILVGSAEVSSVLLLAFVGAKPGRVWKLKSPVVSATIPAVDHAPMRGEVGASRRRAPRARGPLRRGSVEVLAGECTDDGHPPADGLSVVVEGGGDLRSRWEQALPSFVVTTVP